MLPDLTPAVARALESAQVRARLLGAAEVLPLHLLHGLLEEEEGRAASLARAAGLNTTVHRAEAFHTEDSISSAVTPLPLHARAQSALLLARELALDLS